MSYKAVMTLDVKWVPQSESTDNGWPQRLNRWFGSKTTVLADVSFGAGRHFTHLVNAQVTVRRCLFP